MKRKNILLTSFFALACLCGCKSNTSNTSQLEKPTNFTIDFEKSEYSFTGSENATFYSLKVYQYVDNTIDSHAVFSSGMIKATKENNYKNTMDYSFTVGKYRAVLKAIAPRYKANETSLDGESLLLGAPTVSATWNEGQSPMSGPSNYLPVTNDNANDLSIDVSITSTDTITKDYTMVINNTTLGKEVYKNEKVTAGSLNIKYSDLTGVEELTDDDDYTVTVIGNTFDKYVQNKSTTCNVVSQGSGFNFKFYKFSFDKGAKEFKFNLGKTETMKGATATLADKANDGSLYTYNVMKQTGLPFNLEGTLEIKTDTSVLLKMESVGPVQGGEFKGTWTEESNKICVSKLEK